MAYIKGEWRWNDVIDFNLFAHYMNNYYYAYFTSNGEDFEEISMGIDLGGSVWIAYKRDGVAIYLSPQQNPGEMSTYVDEAYRTMDFGGTEQEIDDEFYEILTLVAAQILPIAEKLEIIAENVPKVYEAGKADGRTEGYEAGYNKGYNEGFDTDAYEKGKQAEYDAFWDSYQMNGTRETYQYGAFSGSGWNNITFKPKYPIKAVNVYGMFQDTHITEINNIDFSLATAFSSVFAYSYKVKKIGEINIPNVTVMNATFVNCTGLVTIEKIIVGNICSFDRTFVNCSNLENITFGGEIGNDINFQWSTNLTEASIRSIIGHLSDKASDKTLTLSKTAVETAFVWGFDPEGDGVYDWIFDEGTWEQLELSKPNWEITLV